MAKQQLPDTPWHIGSPKMKESDQRRLNKWCVHYDASICRSPKSGCYMLRCGGSSHCKFYAEDKKAAQKIERDNRTQMEIEAENRRKYVESLKPKMTALISSLDDRRYISVQTITRCFVCGRKLLDLGKDKKKCTLCHMEYVDQTRWLAESTETKGSFVYIMGRKKPAKAPVFQKPIVKTMHLEIKKFTGVKDIPISSIDYGNATIPRQEKVDQEAKAIRRNGGVITPLYIGLGKDRYLLKGGHVRYLAARQCGLYSVPATFEIEHTREK